MTDKTAPKSWPETKPYNDAINAFDAALTLAARDAKFRKRLTDSPASAKAAVAEIGNITIPGDRVIVFYEPQAPKPEATDKFGAGEVAAVVAKEVGARANTGGSSSSENVHVFYLPPLNPQDTTTEYKYEEFFMCCYDQWLRT